MRSHKGLTAAAAAVVSLLATGVASAQPRLENPSGGTGNAEMDHGRMGGSQGARAAGSPALTQPGGGYEMDHSRMGGQGAGSPAGGRITGSSGDGPEVQHGHAPMPERRQGQRR